MITIIGLIGLSLIQFIRSWTRRELFDDKTLDRISARLETQNEREIFTKMRQAYKDVGKARFIEEFCVDGSLRHFTFTAEGELNIHGKIIIHSKAFLQLPVQYRRLLVELCEKLENGEIAHENNMEIKMIRQVCRITFERDRERYFRRICEALNVENIEQVEVGSRRIFEGIKPFEIDRLYNVFTESCNNKNDLIAFGRQIAEGVGCTNITEYCAATEYAIRNLHNEVAARRENANQLNLQNLLADQNFMNSVVQQFIQLQETCNLFRPNNAACNLKFANSMAAANHYDKHKNDFPGRQLTLEEYFNLAVDLTSGQVDDCRVECQWTQDGTTLRREFVSEAHDAFAVVIDRPDGTPVIATLHKLSDKQVH